MMACFGINADALCDHGELAWCFDVAQPLVVCSPSYKHVQFHSMDSQHEKNYNYRERRDAK